MYKTFEISNFRCFSRLEVAPLERINLIAGLNNVGKTALLEGLWIHGGAYNPELAFRVDAFRGIKAVRYRIGTLADAPWNGLFRDFDTAETVELSSRNGDGTTRQVRIRVPQPREVPRLMRALEMPSLSPTEGRQPGEIGLPDSEDMQQSLFPSDEAVSVSSKSSYVLEMTYDDASHTAIRTLMILDREGIRTMPIPPPPPFQTIFLAARDRVSLPEDAERYGNLDATGRQDEVLDVLRVIEPRLRRLSVRVSGGTSMLQCELGLSRLVPLPLAGDGMGRLASLVLAIGNAPGGVVLVDEIENGLHHSVMAKVWRAIGDAARRFDAQVFATTHSMECVAAAHQAFSESGTYDFRLHRLERVNGAIRAVTYDEETLDAALSAGLEVR